MFKTDKKCISKIFAELLQTTIKNNSKPHRKMGKEHEQAIFIRENPKANNYLKKFLKLLVSRETES